jgi:hypothetical protein
MRSRQRSPAKPEAADIVLEVPPFASFSGCAGFHSAFASRHGQFIKDFLDDRFAGFFPGPGFNAKAQRISFAQ